MSTKRAAVAAEALTWVDTPYHHHARLKGVGVDCAQILLAIYVDALQLIEPLDVGTYPPQWHLHRDEERYLDWLQRAGAVAVQSPALGDIAVFQFGRTFSHSAIVVEEGEDPRMVHAYQAAGVICTRASEFPLSGQAVRFFTLPELDA